MAIPAQEAKTAAAATVEMTTANPMECDCTDCGGKRNEGPCCKEVGEGTTIRQRIASNGGASAALAAARASAVAKAAAATAAVGDDVASADASGGDTTPVGSSTPKGRTTPTGIDERGDGGGGDKQAEATRRGSGRKVGGWEGRDGHRGSGRDRQAREGWEGRRGSGRDRGGSRAPMSSPRGPKRAGNAVGPALAVSATGAPESERDDVYSEREYYSVETGADTATEQDPNDTPSMEQTGRSNSLVRALRNLKAKKQVAIRPAEIAEGDKTAVAAVPEDGKVATKRKKMRRKKSTSALDSNKPRPLSDYSTSELRELLVKQQQLYEDTEKRANEATARVDVANARLSQAGERLHQLLHEQNDLKSRLKTSQQHCSLLDQTVARLQHHVSSLTEQLDAAHEATTAMSQSSNGLHQAVAMQEHAVDEARVKLAAMHAAEDTFQSQATQIRTAFVQQIMTMHPNPRVLRPVATTWPGAGSPALLHIQHTAHVCLPPLVQVLVSESARLGLRLMMVGAAAWGAYVDLPLDTEDLDFEISLQPDDLVALLQSCVDAVAATQEVREALAVLDAVSAAMRIKDQDELKRAVQAAERTKPEPDKSYQHLIRVVRRHMGVKVQVGHRTLIDAMEMPTSTLERMRGLHMSQATLSRVLPWRHVNVYDNLLDPAIPVCPVDVLMSLFEESLNSGYEWRLKKDVIRLRQLSHASFLQCNSGGPLADRMPKWKELLARYDPLWLAVLNFQGQLSQLVVSRNTTASTVLQRTASLRSVASTDTSATPPQSPRLRSVAPGGMMAQSPPSAPIRMQQPLSGSNGSLHHGHGGGGLGHFNYGSPQRMGSTGSLPAMLVGTPPSHNALVMGQPNMGGGGGGVGGSGAGRTGGRPRSIGSSAGLGVPGMSHGSAHAGSPSVGGMHRRNSVGAGVGGHHIAHASNAVRYDGRVPHHSGQAPHHSGQAPHHSGQAPHHSGQAPHHSQAQHHSQAPHHNSGQAPHHSSGQTPHHSGQAPHHASPQHGAYQASADSLT